MKGRSTVIPRTGDRSGSNPVNGRASDRPRPARGLPPAGVTQSARARLSAESARPLGVRSKSSPSRSRTHGYGRTQSETAGLPSRHDPADSLHHIIENAERVAHYLAGLDRQAFEQNEATRDAVERCIERVCEAPIARKNLCRANLGATFAAWGIGCDTPTTGWMSVSFGTRCRCGCPKSRRKQDERWSG